MLASAAVADAQRRKTENIVEDNAVTCFSQTRYVAAGDLRQPIEKAVCGTPWSKRVFLYYEGFSLKRVQTHNEATNMPTDRMKQSKKNKKRK